jgi:hypothetical protein
LTLFGFGKLCSPKAWGFASPLLFYPFSLKKNSLDIQILVCYSIIEVALNENQEIEET